MSTAEQQDQQKFEWYYIDNAAQTEEEKVKGPVSIRDLDVMYRTSQINSNTYVCKQGMNNWEPIFKIEILKKTFIEANAEQQFLQPNEEGAFIPSNNEQENKNGDQKILNKEESNIEEDEDELEYMKLLEEDPEKALEKTVQNMIQSKYFQDESGKWKIFDETNQKWITSDKEPTQEMNQLKEELLEGLKKELLDYDPINDAKKPKKKAPRDMTGLTAEQIQKIEKNRKKAKKQKEKRLIKLRELKASTYIYVQNLPEDITIEQMVNFFGKAGIIKEDLQTQEKKIKIYRDEQGNCKGDGLIGYQMEESVQIALEMLNDRYINDTNQISIQRAKFDFNKGHHHHSENKEGEENNDDKKNNDSLKREGVKLDKLQRLKLKQHMQKQQGWEEEDQIVGMQVVIIKNMFNPQEAVDDPDFYQYLEEDLQIELQKLGKVVRLRIYENNPEGTIQIKFGNASQAEECIKVMHNRYFDQRQLVCEYWDGVTDYGKFVGQGQENSSIEQGHDQNDQKM